MPTNHVLAMVIIGAFPIHGDAEPSRNVWRVAGGPSVWGVRVTTMHP